MYGAPACRHQTQDIDRHCNVTMSYVANSTFFAEPQAGLATPVDGAAFDPITPALAAALGVAMGSGLARRASSTRWACSVFRMNQPA